MNNMLIQTEAQIYLSSNRGCTQTEGFRSFHTFNFGDYKSEGREAFGRLIAFNEETLTSEKSNNILVKTPTEILLIPTVGGLELIDRYGESVFVNAGETFLFLAFPESRFTILNPYLSETINYLQLHIKPEFYYAGLSQENIYNESITSFSLEERNIMKPVFSGGGKNVAGFMGKYGGRQEDEFVLKNPDNGTFIYIVQGAFEVQNRLLEVGDALSLLNVETVEFEALSDDGIILVVEVDQS